MREGRYFQLAAEDREASRRRSLEESRAAVQRASDRRVAAARWVAQAIPECVTDDGPCPFHVAAALTLQYAHGEGQVTADMVRARAAARLA